MRGLALAVVVCVLASGFIPVAGVEQPSDKKPVGLKKRIPWTTSAVKGSPEPPLDYRTEPVFPKVKFNEPLDVAQMPGLDRLAVAERKGKLFSFRNDPKTAKADLLLDLKKTVYGMAFHPKFSDNGFLYVTNILDGEKHQPKGTRVSRFTVQKTDPPTVDPASEKIIIEWPSGGHNGGCLKFGPDGYLYIGTGDGSGIADELETGQDLSDLLAAMLRIDVDHPDGQKNYTVPADNPFVKMTGARPENWAYGLRQPWRFSFDRKTGDLWAGEVGQDLWEGVLLIQKGGNYGWSVTEGKHPFRPERKKGPTPILPPVVEHPHSDFRSLTGGYVYRGSRLKELVGTYLYGDFDTGRVWGLRYDGKKVTFHQELARTTLRLVSWGEDTAGEVYLLDFMGGGLHRLVKAPAVDPSPFPTKLSETGLFASTKNLTPAAGLIPYSVNAQLWGDHAIKERYLALPGVSTIDFDGITYPQPSPGAPPGWGFPDGTVLVKTFFLEMERGNPKSKKRLETRLLHFQKFAGTEEIGDQYWRGYTYVWNDEQTDAELLDASGLDKTFTILDKKAAGGKVEQKYHFPSRAECTLCHTMGAKFALGVTTLQMNKDHDYNGVVANQLRTLDALGIFTKPLPKPPEELPALTNYDDDTQPVAKRAVAYLHANCSHCHIKWGGGNADFKLLATLPLKEMGILNVPPAHGTFNLKKPALLLPGDPDNSILYYRMTKLGLGRMPHIASNVVDEKGAKLVYDWIKGMPATEK